MIELMAWSVGDAIEVGSKELVSYVDMFQGYLNSPQFQHDKNEVKQQFNRSADELINSLKIIEQEIHSSLDDVEVNEEKIAKALEQLGEELTPLVEEFADSGDQIAIELEQFFARLEQRMSDHGRSKAKLSSETLESLIQSLEQLNQRLKEQEKE